MYLSASAVAVSTWGTISSARPFFTFIKLYFIITILTVHTARTLRVFEILKPRRALSTRTQVRRILRRMQMTACCNLAGCFC